MRQILRLNGMGHRAGNTGGRMLLVFTVIILACGGAQAFDPAQSLSVPKQTAAGLNNAAALQKSGALLVPNAGSTIYDTTVPVAGKATAPGEAKANPVTITYTGAADDGGSGLKSVNLWVRYGASGVWTDTGLSATGASGSFSYSATFGDGTYYFGLKALDNAGNASPNPSGTGDSQLVFDTTPPVISLLGGNVTIQTGTAYTDAGATATDAQDGDLTAKIVTKNPVNTGVPGTYTVTYNVTDAAGNAAQQVSRTVTVVLAPTTSVTVIQPAHGSISVNPLPGSDGKFAVGTALTFTYTPDSTARYDLSSWSGATQDSANPNVARLTVTTAPATVSAATARQTGSISVTVAPTSASWTVTDGDSVTHDGTGTQVLSNIPTGSVSILYKPLTGMTTPSAQSATLAKGATVPFSGTYVSQSGYTVSVATGLSGTPGSSVTCPINLSNATSLASYSVQITFDSSLVECTGVTSGSLTGSWGNPTATVASGSVSVNGSGAALAGGSGSLAVLQLHILAGATAPSQSAVHFAVASLNNGGLKALTQDGTISVQAGQFLWGDVNGDKTVSVVDADLILKFKTGLVSSLPDPDAAGVSGEPPVGPLDAADILKKCVGVISKFPADTNGDGMGPEPTVPSGTAKSTSVADSIIKQLEKSTTRNISTIGSATLTPNVTVSAPISLDDANAVQGYYLDVAYDNTDLDFVSVGKGSLTQGWGDPTVNPQPGHVLIAGAGVNGLSGSGSLVVITFKALGTVVSGTTGTFAVDTAELNNGTLPLQIGTAQGAPVVATVTPNSGANIGGTLVTLKGSNLGAADDVLFGTQPAAWFRVDSATSSIQAITPAGTIGAVDVSVNSPGGTNTLTQGFTYFAPDVYLAMNPAPQVLAGSFLDVPITLETTGVSKPAVVTFVLRFDPKLFTLKLGGSTDQEVTIGADAAGAGASIVSAVAGEGTLTVTVGASSTSGSVIPDGALCTCHLLAISNTTNTNGLLYLNNVSAGTVNNAKSLRAAGGIATSKRSVRIAP